MQLLALEKREEEEEEEEEATRSPQSKTNDFEIFVSEIH